MKIILIENVKNVGRKGDLKEVSNGYAQNFLFPKKLAESATAENIKEWEKLRNKMMEKDRQEIKGIKETIAQIENRNIIIKRREKNKKLFGSITAKDIAEELKKNSLEIDEKAIVLPKPIKNLGEHKVELKFNHDLKTYFNLSIQGE
jgi:large subunit ribosomal protein L9